MQAHTAHPNPLIQYAITAIVILVVVGLRWYRSVGKARRLRLEMLWLVPTIYFVVAVMLFYEYPPSAMGWALSIVALLLGAALGWQRGKLMHIAVDPETHALNQTASPAAMVFIVVLIAMRQGARYLAETNPALHPYAGLATNLLVALGLGVFSMMRLEMYLRARRLLATARGVAA